MIKHVNAGVLKVAYLEAGKPGGWPAILLHGFPYDPQIFAETTSILAASGARVFAPWLRGYGGTEFLSTATPRSGQQAALGADLLAFLQALNLPPAILAGHDWGGRAACIAASQWPERVAGLVSQNGYTIQDIAAASHPAPPQSEARLWYQYYFHSERGRAALTSNREDFCRYLWQLWSPTWQDAGTSFARTAASFENPDFAAIVIHSYRHRFGIVGGDPAYDAIEMRLAEQPRIPVPAITLDGDADGVTAPREAADHARHFSGPHEHRIVSGAGHNLPQEAPADFAQAVLDVRSLAQNGAR